MMKDFNWKFNLGLQVIILTVQYSKVLGDLETRKKKIFDMLSPYYQGQAIVLEHHLKQIDHLYGKKLILECVELARSLSKELQGEDITNNLAKILAKRKRLEPPDISIRKGLVKTPAQLQARKKRLGLD